MSIPPFTRRQTIKSTFAIAASSLFPLGIARAETPQPTPKGPIKSASLSVSARPAGSIGPAFVGLSFEKSKLQEPLFTGTNSNLISILKRLGPGVLRIGGNSVEQSVWSPNGPGKTWGHIAPSDVDALAAFLRPTNWKCLYGVNLAGAATGAATPALAAAEVAYVAKALGSSLLGVEIGNEPDSYGLRNMPFAGNWSLPKYIALWQQFRSAILATTPGVMITGPGNAENVTTWTVPFAKAVTAKQISLLTQHYYRANGHFPLSTAEFLVSPDSRLLSELATLRATAQQIGVPYRMTECNSYYDGAAEGVASSYATALWAIDFLFNCAQQGAIGVNFHGGGNGSYTPISEVHDKIIGTRPLFYGILFFTLAGQGALYATQLDAGSLNATAYAVKAPSGKLTLVLVNKDASQNIQLKVQLPQKASKATLLSLTQSSGGAIAPSLHAHEGVAIQGAAVNSDGSFAPSPAYSIPLSGTQLTCYLPALSAALIQLT